MVINALLGLIPAIIIGILIGVISHKNRSIDSLKNKNNTLNKQVEIDKLFQDKLKELKDANSTSIEWENVDSLIDDFNAGKQLSDDK